MDRQSDEEFDDEELDSDEAFNSEDEREYGWAFKGKVPSSSSSSSSSSSKRHPLEDEQDEMDELDQEDEEDGVYSVLDLINKREESAAKEKKVSANDGDDGSDDSDDEDPNLGNHEALLRHVARVANGKKRKRNEGGAGAGEEDQDSSRKKTTTTTGEGELTADDLLSSLRNSSGVAQLKKRVEKLEEGTAVTAAPKARIHRKRAERALGYEHAKKDATDWTALVTKNREAEHVEFAADGPSRAPITTADMVDKFRPTTEMENQIDALLTSSGMDESSLKNTEDRALAMNDLTEEEVRFFWSLLLLLLL